MVSLAFIWFIAPFAGVVCLCFWVPVLFLAFCRWLASVINDDVLPLFSRSNADKGSVEQTSSAILRGGSKTGRVGACPRCDNHFTCAVSDLGRMAKCNTCTHTFQLNERVARPCVQAEPTPVAKADAARREMKSEEKRKQNRTVQVAAAILGVLFLLSKCSSS